MKTILIALVALIAGTLLGSQTYQVPLRTFSVDSQGNQHCSGLRHNEHFEVFCLSTERPTHESFGRNLDRTIARHFSPAAEDRAAPWRPQWRGETYGGPEEARR